MTSHSVRKDLENSVAATPVEMFNSISDFRSAAAIEYYVRNYGVEHNVAEEHFVEMLKFLAMAACYPGKITPSEQLDEMWHAMIIQTLDYQKVSERLGYFVHHSTTSAPLPERYDYALDAYRQFFGEPHAVWSMAKLPVIEDTERCRIVGWCSTCNDAVAA